MAATQTQLLIRMSNVAKLTDSEREKIFKSKCPIHTRKFILDPNDHQEEMINSDNNENVSLPSASADRIRVLDYNILKDEPANFLKYSYCDKDALMWEESRKFNIAKEILFVNPDIIALQEVDHSNWWDRVFGVYGYDGFHAIRPGGNPHGLSFYFKKDKLEFVRMDHLIFSDHVEPPVPPKTPLEEIRFKADNTACLALLKLKESNTEFAVATTHIQWYVMLTCKLNGRNPLLSDLKVMQSLHLLLELEKFVKTHASAGMNTPLIVTGDFNSTPSSAVYELYAKGAVSGNHDDMLLNKVDKNFTHNFKLKSAYEVLNEPATNVTPSFTDTIDYVWYSHETVQLKAVLDIFSKKEYFKHTALPSILWSSDHVSVAAEFTLTQPK